MFRVRVAQVARLSPTFRRVTFTGEDLDRFADNGFDQRIKLVLPAASGGGFDHLPTGPDWYLRWRSLPDAHRNPIRTYTVRAVRAGLRQVDIDLASHGDSGTASRWVRSAAPGDPVTLLGPDAGYDGIHGGVEWRPPPASGRLLLAGDETAVPAILAILERLPPGAQGEALLEVPSRGDCALAHQAPDGVTVSWLPREGSHHGQLLLPAVRASLSRLVGESGAGSTRGGDLEGVDTDSESDQAALWEVPDQQGPHVDGGIYAWLAGEAGIVKTLRRLLLSGHAIDRRSVAFMGYWRLGRSADGEVTPGRR
jgi:NADPH-dependent ferric siderophore reductase